MEAPPLERKLAAILAADVEGYSRMMHADEEGTLRILSSHRAIVDKLIGACHGRISGTAGDCVLAEFASVLDAYRCAVAIQQALHRANAALAPEQQMHLRIGINVGDVMIKDGDLFGDGVNIAARLEGLAEPGGICVTREARDHLRDRLDAEFVDMGEHSVKNIARPVRVFRVAFDPEGTTDIGPVPAKSDAAGSETGPAQELEATFWQSVQDSDDPREYRAYLERYPDGVFAELARARLNRPDPEPAVAAAADPAIELTFWDSIKDSDNPEMFQAYLEQFPEGVFKSLARIRLQELHA